jgi:hypothetical protein
VWNKQAVHMLALTMPPFCCCLLLLLLLLLLLCR